MTLPSRTSSLAMSLPNLSAGRNAGVKPTASPAAVNSDDSTVRLTAWDAEHIASLVREYEASLPPGGWPNWVLGNHDKPRIAARIGRAQARIAAMLLLTLRGTPTLYYGDEIGMRDVPIPPEQRQDPWVYGNRDPVRTPMPWPGLSWVPALRKRSKMR